MKAGAGETCRYLEKAGKRRGELCHKMLIFCAKLGKVVKLWKIKGE